MTTARDIRRMAFQALFQLDVRGEADVDSIRASMEQEGKQIPAKDIDRAIELALAAYRDRAAADDELRALAPTWPAHRQPAVDRAIIRLAHHEMSSGRTNAKIAVNEAVELAKEFSTERSPAFINGVLDKILKRVLLQAPGGADMADDAELDESHDAAHIDIEPAAGDDAARPIG